MKKNEKKEHMKKEHKEDHHAQGKMAVKAKIAEDKHHKHKSK